jgi:5-methylcytosine-specific restriction endonuclease McrA
VKRLLARVAPEKPQPERPASDFIFQEYNRSIKMKVCSKCKELKPRSEFRPRSDSKDGLRGQCRLCHNAKTQETYWQNIERNREKCKKYYAENQSHIVDYQNKYYLSRREELLDRQKQYFINNREKVKAYKDAYYEKNQPELIAQHHIEKAIKRGLIADFTGEQWRNALAHFDFACAYCGESDCGRIEQEHVIPLSKGGHYTANNIIPSCKSCNSSKHSRDFEHWYLNSPMFSESRYLKIISYLAGVDNATDRAVETSPFPVNRQPPRESFF